MSRNRDLSQHALFLRNAAPEEWGAFVQAFRRAADEAVMAVTQVDAASILGAQGRAQQALSFLRTFEECEKTPQPPAPR
jgi:hypothetical protein